MNKKSLFHTLSALCLCLPGMASAIPYSGLYVFGDSLSDTGNVAALSGGAVPGPVTAYTRGRFTNNYNYVDEMAASLGLSAQPSLLGGTNYAFGGARTNSHPDVGSAGSVLGQVNTYTSLPGAADPGALYVVFGGANNIRDAIGTFSPATAVSAAYDVAAAVNNLYLEGARHVLVANAPNLGRVPAINALHNPALSAFASGLSVSFNDTLSVLLDHLMMVDAGIDVRRLDTYTTLENLINSGATLGFTNVTDSCYTGDDSTFSTPAALAPSLTCSNPDQYVFWDSIHPTAATQHILAAAALAAVPEPDIRWLWLAGALGWVATRRRGRATGLTPAS